MMKVTMVRVTGALIVAALAVALAGPAVERVFADAGSQAAPAATEPAAPGKPAPLHGRVVLAKKPEGAVAKALVSGVPVTQDEWSRGAISDKSGDFQIPHAASNMYLVVQTADQKLGAVVLVKPEDENVVIRLVPTTSAYGRLVDADGKPMARQSILFGITMEKPAPQRAPTDGPRPVRMFNAGSSSSGLIKTGEDGTFTISGLVPGQGYELSTVIPSPRGARRIYPLEKITPDSAKVMDLGDLSVRPATKPATRPAAGG